MFVPRLSRIAGVVLPLVLVALCVACGSDGSGSSSDTSAPDTASTASGTVGEVAAADASYCVAALALNTDPGPDIDFATATPDEIAAGVQSYATDILRPLFDDLEAEAPAELNDAVETFGAAIDEVIDTGDPSALESAEVTAASETAHAYDLAHCGYLEADVTASDYQFDDVELEYSKGPVSFELTNDGPEVHEMILLKVRPQVSETAEELIALPQDEALTKVDIVNTIGPVEPGGTGHMVADLEPARYIVACFLPQGSTSMQALETADGAPHASLGMFRAISVDSSPR